MASPAPRWSAQAPPAPVGRTLALVRSERRRLWLVTLLAAGTAACGISLLATSAWLISRAAQRPSVVELGVAIIGVRFFAISRGLCRYAERLVGHDAALRVLADIRVRVYVALEALAPGGLPAFRGGDLLTRLVQDVEALQDLMVRVIPPFGAAVVVGTMTVATVWYLLPPAGLILAVALITGGVLVPWCGNRLSRWREGRLVEARGRLSADVVDLLEGAPDLMAYGAMDAQLALIRQTDAELTRVATATAGVSGAASLLVTLLTGAAVWGSLLVGVPAVHDGHLHGPLLAVIALIPLAAFEMVVGLPAAAQYFDRARRSAARVLEVIDAEVPIAEPDSPRPLPRRAPYIHLRGLRARYGPDQPWVLDGVDVDLAPGRRIGIVGPSGAGKSTLAAVLTRLVAYEEGSVQLDGIELSRCAGDGVRRIVGWAGQDVHVFDSTLRANLILARPDADEADLRLALHRSNLLDWVDDLPGGLETAVGGHGVRMSGGQQQRLGIARACLADFPVLIADEPGEHLDTPTAEAVVSDLIRLREGRSTILITHRLAGLEVMDEILVLDAGRVVERGTHDQLLAAGGRYAEQWQREGHVRDEGVVPA